MYDNLLAYCLTNSEEEPEVLKEIKRITYLSVIHPRMLCGPLIGNLLKLLCVIKQPKRVLEIGTFTGYSAVYMAMGIPANSYIDTIEIDVELEDIIKRTISHSGYAHKINVHFGDALNIIPTLKDSYDFVFIDGDKRKYIDFYQAVFPKLPPHAIIVADNVLWDGHVLDPANKESQTLGLKKFNDYIKKDTRVENVLLPLRDGINLIVKL
ncbi:MAG: O-methyltransferase [Bacteroidales bacterium]